MYKLIAAFAISQLAALSPEAPFHEPQLAAGAGLVAMTFGAGADVYVSVSANNGDTFGKPVKVATAPVVPLTRHRGPRIVISGKAIVVTAVVGQTAATGQHAHGLPSDGDLLAWRSTDRGVTWSMPVRINDVPAAPTEGLHTLASDGHGILFAAWLDKRGRGTALYGAWSSDAGATWTKNVDIYDSPDGTICECCHPSAAFDRDRGLDLMWRNVLDGSRDFYLLHADAAHRFGAPRKVGDGTWKINACPMDGGGLVHAGARTITAWRRMNDIFMAEPGKPETKIGEGKDVTMAAAGDRVYVAWIKDDQLILWENGNEQKIAAHAAYPALTSLPAGGALLAWEENNGISTRRLQ